MPAPDTFSTDRLVARRIDRADEPFLEAMFRDPAVHATLGGPRDVAGVEQLYAIASARWREGLATEAGREAVEITRGLGLDELVCFTLVDNIASRRTMEGLGFTGALPVRHAGLPHVLTRLVLRQREVSERG